MFGIKNKITTYWIYKNLPDQRALFDSGQERTAFKKNYDDAIGKFKSIHNIYTSEVSSDTMAASLEACASLYSFCILYQPKYLLDMGSGISSLVLRIYQKEKDPDCVVYSVDDDEKWLEKTVDFLDKNNVNTENIFALSHYQNLPNLKFDLIFHDLNFVEERIKHVQSLIDRSSRNTIFIFDDVHKPRYYTNLMKILVANKLIIKNLKEFSKDKFGRFAILAKRNS